MRSDHRAETFVARHGRISRVVSRIELEPDVSGRHPIDPAPIIAGANAALLSEAIGVRAGLERRAAGEACPSQNADG